MHDTHWIKIRTILTLMVGVGVISVCSFADGQLLRPPSIPKSENELVRYWLDAGWPKNLANRAQSAERYESAQPQNPDVAFAYAINRIRHNRARDAAKVVNQFKLKHRDHVDLLLVSIWLNTMLDEVDVALVDMQAFADAVKADPKIQAKLAPAYRRIGRILGYLQGPVAGRANADELGVTITKLIDGIPDLQKLALLQEMNAVIDKHDQLIKKIEQDIQNSAINNLQAHHAQTKQVEIQAGLLQNQADQLRQQKGAVQQQGQQLLNAALQDLAPLESELQGTIADIDAVRYRIQLQQSSLFFTIGDPDVSPLTTDLIRLQLQQDYLTLSTLRATANSLANRVSAQRANVNEIRQNYGLELNRLSSNLRRTNNLQQRTNSRLVKLAKGPQPDKGKLKARSNRTRSLAIYDRLPLELYRSEILKSLQD